MSDQPPPPEDPARQLRQHLDSLRASGVEWLPFAALPVPPRSPEPAPHPEPVPPPTPRTSPTRARPVEAPAPQAVQTGLFVGGTALPEGSGELDRRRYELEMLAQEVSKCQRCAELWTTRTQTVFGVGPLDAELCFVGEAPGFDEDQQGVPFVGAAGQLLNRIIAACGLKREEVYICNILRCRPPKNRQPTAEEAGNCHEYLEKTLELVRPKFICALGGTATTYLLGTTTGITRLRGKWLEYRGIPVLCTFHPSYLLRKPEAKKDVWEDMKALLTRMGRPIPGRS